MVLTTALLATAAYYLSERQQAMYQASSDVFLGTQDLAASLANVAQPYVDPVREAATQASLAQSPAVAQLAIRSAQIKNRTADDLLGETSVVPNPDADILSFTVTDTDPTIAARLATAYSRAYRAYRRSTDTASLVRARTEIDQRLAQLTAAGDGRTQLYANLAEKDQQLRTMEVLQGSNVLVVRPAGGAVKTQPQPRRNTLLGAVLGFVLGIGLTFLRDALNTRVGSSAEVESLLHMPLLARLPEPHRRLRGKNRLVMLDAPGSPEAEAYRVLAANVDFVNLDHGARSIMITSARHSEGKSTTVANLAVAFARAGRRVLLVDLDLRRPSVAGFFALEDRPGLTHVVMGHSTLEEAIVPVPIHDPPTEPRPPTNGSGHVLEVLTTGLLPPNPGEFVRLEALADTLTRAEQRVDLVLVDAPPLLDLSDAMTLSSRVDGLIAAVHIGDIRRATLDELLRVLDSAPVVKLGCVVTGAEAQDGYGGYSGYGYSYGYHSSSSARHSEATR